MDNTFKFAPLNNKEDLLRDITKYENELSGKAGQDIILIAYTRDRSQQMTI